MEGAEVGFSHSEVPTQRLGRCGYDSERKKGDRLSKRSARPGHHLLSLIGTGCVWSPPSVERAHAICSPVCSNTPLTVSRLWSRRCGHGNTLEKYLCEWVDLVPCANVEWSRKARACRTCPRRYMLQGPCGAGSPITAIVSADHLYIWADRENTER